MKLIEWERRLKIFGKKIGMKCEEFLWSSKKYEISRFESQSKGEWDLVLKRKIAWREMDTQQVYNYNCSFTWFISSLSPLLPNRSFPHDRSWENNVSSFTILPSHFFITCYSLVHFFHSSHSTLLNTIDFRWALCCYATKSQMKHLKIFIKAGKHVTHQFSSIQIVRIVSEYQGRHEERGLER